MPEKNNKLPKFFMIFARKNIFPEFFFFGGGECTPAPPSLRLRSAQTQYRHPQVIYGL